MDDSNTKHTHGKKSSFDISSGNQVINTKSQRLETLGLLSSGVAHDFNNVLTGILGHITFLKTILPANGKHAESIAAIEDGARKSASMTQQILRYSRFDPEEQPIPFEIVDVVKKTMTLLRGAISPEYKIVVNLPESNINILGIEAKFAQILTNLVINARDASEKNKKIEISISKKQSKESKDDQKSFVCLKVLDYGQGISDEDLNRIFIPFFSTKKEHGTGLGLTTVKKLVEEMQGKIIVQSKVGKGSVFSVYFPEYLEEDVVSDVQEELVKSLKGERILVVDDESSVRNVVVMSLEHLGYKVDSAESGEEGIELYKKNKGNYELIILDMLMPKMSGEQTFMKLKEINKDCNILLISGFVAEEVLERIKSKWKFSFINKPFTIEELSIRVSESLQKDL